MLTVIILVKLCITVNINIVFLDVDSNTHHVDINMQHPKTRYFNYIIT
jgi:hypothetical protein